MIKILQHKEYKVEEHVTFFMIHDIQLWKHLQKKYATFKTKNPRTLRDSFQNFVNNVLEDICVKKSKWFFFSLKRMISVLIGQEKDSS